ncbi:MAG: hypothetical protein LBL90_02670 [Prevotellaceae bacterium]|jgi:tetratricopeptide (TPR) repeat protein|nr:hypothetical protein [Prevotellaceae bacterium]
MIDLKRFLKGIVYITTNELEQLEQLATEYPWFSLAHQIVLMGYKQHDDPRFIGKCHQTALYTLNRKRLYNFLEKASKATTLPPSNSAVINTGEILTVENTGNTDSTKDDLLLNFSHEYFSLDDLSPIDAADYNEETNDQLITKFISENPRIIPKSSSIADLDDLIQLDEEFENEPASETLAKIYISQGLFDKAISTYEKLSLLNPEKSIYFAFLIDNLKNKEK